MRAVHGQPAYSTLLTCASLGGNSGIGKQTVTVLASKGARVYLAAHTKEKYEQAMNEIHTSYPATVNGEIHFLHLDLSTANGAKAAAEDFKL